MTKKCDEKKDDKKKHHRPSPAPRRILIAMMGTFPRPAATGVKAVHELHISIAPTNSLSPSSSYGEQQVLMDGTF